MTIATTDYAGAIARISDAMDAIRAELAKVDIATEQLEGRRQTVVAALPHTDDIAGALVRGARAAAQDFAADLRDDLQGRFLKPGSASATGSIKSFEMLRAEGGHPDAETLKTRVMRGQVKSPLNVGALAYLLLDKIEAEVPALVLKLCPDARSGMKQSDREAALKEIDAELARLKSERGRLNADLSAARMAVNGRR